MVYDELAQASTKACNDHYFMSRITKKESLPPGILLASKTAREEFEPCYQKEAWPTIIYTPDKGVGRWQRAESCRKIEDLLQIILPAHKRSSQFTVVLSSMCDEEGANELWLVTDLIDDLIYQGQEFNMDLDPDKTIEKIRVIWYVQRWETMRQLQTSENELNEDLSRAWHFLFEANEHMQSQFRWTKRFPALTNLELCVRYKEEQYVFQYTNQDCKVEADILFVPRATHYRDRREIVAWTFSELLGIYKALWPCICGLTILILYQGLQQLAFTPSQSSLEGYLVAMII